MPIELPIGWVIVLNVAGWPAIQVGLAWAFTRMPAAWFKPREAHGWERGGRVYERVFAVKRWKDRLPDGARWFGGGFAKGTLRSADIGHLRRFVRETWRGELCHWAALAFVPLFFLWNPWWADLVIVAYAAAANLPCILAQRYNRARFQRALARKPHAGP
ncbi:MAG TPA: glycosyl-4,4'-diaponeurosporenoate acyltransferase [Candidatus Paceibacterota bacterium]|nr:glycosyl-4,4'-diaponeurosporenoate acyltransferase [Candidatus Paceibacterota bacterium]HRZ55934.1 glycosyl-4,4'-diaponeurosporenoate acyltransferase [Candidatus Paceibacterota bacterium]